jgi:hypothetical protein
MKGRKNEATGPRQTALALSVNFPGSPLQQAVVLFVGKITKEYRGRLRGWSPKEWARSILLQIEAVRGFYGNLPIVSLREEAIACT